VIDPQQIDKAIDQFHADSRRVYPQHTNRASQGGITCTRRLLWHRTNWERAALPDVGLQRRFALGNVFEDIVSGWLGEAGFKVVGSQRDLVWRTYELTGHIDGELEIDAERALLETKSCSEFVYRRIERCSTAADLVAIGKDYITGYVVQTGLYIFQLNREEKREVRFGLILFVNKNSGQTHCVIIDALDRVVLDLVEAHLKRLERVNAAVAAGEDIEAEPGEYCTRCPFLGACAPIRDFGQGMTIGTDELADLVEIRQANAEAAKEFEDADAAIKRATTQPGDILAGRWLIRVKEITTTKYDVPETVRQQFAAKVPQLRRSFVPLTADKSAAAEEVA
jgi:hypothetical protein